MGEGLRSPGGMGVSGSSGAGDLVNMEAAPHILSPLSPQEARGSEDGEPGLGGARVEGKDFGGPDGPASGATLEFAACASPNDTEPGHALQESRPGLGHRPLGFDQSGRGTCCTLANGSLPVFAYHPRRFKYPFLQIHARIFCSGGAWMQMKGVSTKRKLVLGIPLQPPRLFWSLRRFLSICVYVYMYFFLTAPPCFLVGWFATTDSRSTRR